MRGSGEDSQCGVVLAEDLELAVLDEADGHVCEKREEVHGATERVLADQARGVGTSRAAFKVRRSIFAEVEMGIGTYLKYRREIALQRFGSARGPSASQGREAHNTASVPEQRSCITVSHITFVFPYGLSACILVVSGMGMTGGVPYTVALDE